MKLSFASLGCPNWTIEQIVKNAGAMGFDGVELRGIPNEHISPDEPRQERERIRRLFADAGLQIASIMGYSRYIATDPAIREENIENAIKLLDLARDLNCPLQRVFIGMPDGAFDLKAVVPRVAEGLKRVVAHAEKVGVKVAIETHDAWTEGASVRAILDAVNSPMLGICWDVSNSYFIEPLEKTFAAIKEAIIHVHFKDAKREGDAIVCKLPGQGEVDLLGAAILLEQFGYDGFYSFEWEKRHHPELADAEVAFPLYIALCREFQESLKISASK